MKRVYLVIIIISSLIILFSCNGNNRKSAILTGYMSGYNNNTREKKNLKPEQREISGIIFLNDGQKLASINDEEGKIFIIDYSKKDSTKSNNFAAKGDFEDIVMDEKYFHNPDSFYRAIQCGFSLYPYTWPQSLHS